MRYDAIVVGAGPAGSTAARLLAQDGVSVLLLDRAPFPRDKPCGGGVTIRAASYLDLDLSPVVEGTIYGARFSLRLGPHFDRWFPLPLTYMTQRCRLDSFLVQAATQTGVSFHDGETARSLEVTDGTVTITTNRSSYTTRLLIGADGANGLSARFISAHQQWRQNAQGVALEGNVPLTGHTPDEWRELVALDLGGLAGGYGWVFPKGDHLNIGVGAWKYSAFTLRAKLAYLCRRYGFDYHSLRNLRGHHLPVRRRGSPVVRGPILLVGDAAGFVEPLSGEGIHLAFLSAHLAAESSFQYLSRPSSDLSTYQRAVEQRIQPELDISQKLQELFYFAPTPYVALLRHSEHFWRLFCHLIRGELSYQSFSRKIGPLRLLVNLFAKRVERQRLSRLAIKG